ncbi:MAG: tetratricopeptide repeat protein [Bryobacterales bacterium]|nr:tetratricopeptide repeat protein [Bryobacterales bacterium]
MTGLLFLLLLPASTEPDATKRLTQCIESRDKSCLTNALKSPPGHGSAEYLSAAADAYLMLGRNEDAMTAIGAALKTKPHDYDLLMQQGRTYQRCGEQVQAIQSFLLAAKAKQSSDVFYGIGMSFFLLHEHERAGQHFAHAVQLDEKNHKAEFMLGVIDILKDNNEAGAKAHFERALAMDPGNPHYLLHYGILLMEHNDREGAAKMLEKAAKSDPANPLVHFNLGRLCRQMGDMPRARTELEAAVRLRPELARAHYQLAAVYRELGEPAKAKRATEQFLKFKDQDQDNDPIGNPASQVFKDPKGR